MKQRKPIIHGRDHRPGGPDPIPGMGTGGSGGELHLKVFGDRSIVTVRAGAFQFGVPPSMDGLTLQSVWAYVTTASSSGALTIQVRNVTTATDVLSTPITIDATEKDSSSATAAVIGGSAGIAESDQIAIDVDAAGTGAKGLGVVLAYG